MTTKDWQWCAIHGDSREYLHRIPDYSIDLILTDPPYNLGKYSTGNIPLPGRTAINNDLASWDKEDFNPEEWADEFVRILKPEGNLFIFTSYNMIGKWHALLDHKFDASNFMVWHKTNPTPKIFKTGFLNSCELIFICWNKKHKWHFGKQSDMHNFFESPICMRPERLSEPKHPTQKPIALLEHIIKLTTNPGDIVFDPFMGVGSTGVAAINLNRRFIGIEKQEDYALAAKKRISNSINLFMIEEPAIKYGNAQYTQIDEFVYSLSKDNNPTGLSPIIKWAGGKEKELPYILNNLPNFFTRFIDPFVGGGAVSLGIKAKNYIINDLSSELIGLYNCIAAQNELFFNLLNQISESWQAVDYFFEKHQELVDHYKGFAYSGQSKTELSKNITNFISSNTTELIGLLPVSFLDFSEFFIKELQVNLLRKMTRMSKLEKEKGTMPPQDLSDNIETALKSALYMFYRNIYNVSIKHNLGQEKHSALFFFIRNLCYSGMFRYNDKGEFNVPYGGIGYNSKNLNKKIEYYQNADLIEHLKKTSIYNLDFEEFLNLCSPTRSDFIFLDPPYDSEFSTYAQNEFTQKDQERLAEYLKQCPAKWMLVIKNTEFIYSLYTDTPGIYIASFDKKYAVSFMNRNNRNVTHLLITNYALPK